MSVLRRNLLLVALVCPVFALWSFQSLAQEQGEDQVQQPAARAIGSFLERLFRGSGSEKEERRPTEAEDAEDNTPKIPLDPIDERAVVNPERLAQFERANHLLKEGEVRDGAMLLQQLLDAGEDSLTQDENGQWQSLHEAILRLIMGMSDDAPVAGQLRLVNESAREELVRARQQGGVSSLGTVSRRYFATQAGQEAAHQIGSLMFDAGHLHEAAYWYRRLKETDAPLTRTEQWQQRAELVQRLVNSGDSQAGSPQRDKPRTQWTAPFGGPTHAGRLVESDPVLIARWSQPTTERPQVAQEITRLVEDLHDAGRSCVPVAIPLLVDGKVVFRTMRGLSVVDAENGHQLWETPEGISIERMLTGDNVSRPGDGADQHRVRPLPLNQGSEADYHALTGPLFRDGVYGLISSDGEQVFALEDHATLSYQQPGYAQGRQRQDDPYGRDWDSNRLVAYRLETGRISWAVGGTQLNDRFDPPLAGVLFQGPPVVEGDELFVIGEHRGVETLFVLDRRTGEKLWSHALATVSTEIDNDLVRRWWPALPAVGPGVILCPTTVGWMMAIDRQERRIRWAQRITPRRENQQQSRQATLAINGPVDHRWAVSAPILADGHVLFAPPELPDPVFQSEAQLICLDVLTGKQLWHRAKENGLYVAGVVDGTVLLVSSDRVEARRLYDGHRTWQSPIDEDAGPPSGRGVITGDDYLLPLQSGQLWRISLLDGAIVEKSRVSVPEEPLGNLLVDQGRLLSLTPLAMTSFASRQAIEASVAQAKETPLTPAAALQAAELSMIDETYQLAREILTNLRDADLSFDQKLTRERLLRNALVALIEKDPASAGPFLTELRLLVSTPQLQLEIEQLEAERLATLGRLPEAFEVYWQRAHSPVKLMVTDGDGTVRIDRWLSRRLSDLWSAMTTEERADIDAKVVSLISSLPESASGDHEWWASVFRFHPARIPLEQQLAVQASSEGRLGESELRFLRLLGDHIPRAARSQALASLLQLLDEQDRGIDISTMVPARTDILRDNNEHADRFADAEITSERPSDWTSEEFELTRIGAALNRRMMQLPVQRADGVPSLDQLRFRVQQQLQRLNVDRINGERVWELPLQFQSDSQFNQLVAAGSIGQTMFLVHRGVLHAISLADRTLLWHRTFDTRSANGGYARHAFSAQPQSMTTASVFRMTHVLRRQAAPMGMLASWNPDYVCYYGRNNITVVDSLTGETLWTRNGIGPLTKVIGNSRHLFIIPPSPAKPFAMDASDGSLTLLPQFDDLLKDTIAIDEQGLVTLDVEKSGFLGLGKRDSTLQVVDERTAEVRWTVTFPEGTQFIQLQTKELLALEPEGWLRLISWTDQADRTIGKVDAGVLEKAESLFAISDQQQVYLSLVRESENHYWSDRVDSIPANGTLATYDREGSGLVWQEEVTDTNLLIEHFGHLPVLVLHARRLSPGIPNAPAQQVQFQMLDKGTGKSMLDETRYVSASTFREIDFDLTARTIDLKTYREQLRIQPKGNGRLPSSDDPAEHSQN